MTEGEQWYIKDKTKSDFVNDGSCVTPVFVVSSDDDPVFLNLIIQ